LHPSTTQLDLAAAHPLLTAWGRQSHVVGAGRNNIVMASVYTLAA